MEKQFLIYGLVDPDTKEIRYVGKSSYGLKRPKEHFKPSNYLKQKNHKAHWIKKLISEGKLPEIIVLKTAETEERLNQLEIETIKYYRDAGNALTNGTDGGEGSLGWVPNADNRKNMSEARKTYYATLAEPPKAPNKKEHIFNNGVECKTCSDCSETKPLTEFGISKSNWDNLHHICKICNATRTAALRAKNPHPRLTAEQLAQSYADRKAAMSAGVKKAYEENKELKAAISANNSKAIEGINILTGEKIQFKSALEAKAVGFQNSNLGQSIRKGIAYKGYMWRFI